jgi:hypothetical protein
MLKTVIAPLALALALTGAAHASGKVELTDENTAQIRQVLTEQGYEVAKIKLEDGMYEAYAKKNGQRYEVYLDADFQVVKAEED